VGGAADRQEPLEHVIAAASRLPDVTVIRIGAAPSLTHR
jgi:hypothetical protein